MTVGRPKQMAVSAASMSDGRIQLRIMERRDIEAARCLHNEFSVLLKLTDVRHISEPEQDAWFERMSLAAGSRRYVVEEIDNGAFVGVLRLDRIDLQNRNAWIGLDIVPDKRGRGYGKAAFCIVMAYLFDQLGLHRLSLVTLETNLVAINLYRSLGFQEEGRLREAIWRDGKFSDLLQFGLLRQEWREGMNAR